MADVAGPTAGAAPLPDVGGPCSLAEGVMPVTGGGSGIGLALAAAKIVLQPGP